MKMPEATVYSERCLFHSLRLPVGFDSIEASTERLGLQAAAPSSGAAVAIPAAAMLLHNWITSEFWSYGEAPKILLSKNGKIAIFIWNIQYKEQRQVVLHLHVDKIPFRLGRLIARSGDSQEEFKYTTPGVRRSYGAHLRNLLAWASQAYALWIQGAADGKSSGDGKEKEADNNKSAAE